MKYVFAGTDEFAVSFLSKLVESYHPPEIVLTQKPKPRGRGLRIKPTPVAEWAKENNVNLVEIDSFKDLKDKKGLFNGFDLLLVCSFGLYIPDWFTSIFKYTVNFHPSLLPEYRGAAPVRRALMDGRQITGVSLIEVASEMDAGRIYSQKEVKIEPSDNYETLSKKLLAVGIPLLISTLRGVEKGHLQLREQQGIPTYAAKIKKEELWIDWSKTSENIQNLIRALSPAPGARTLFRNRQLKILKSIPITDIKGKPGEIVVVEKDGFIVACGKDGLKILEVQPENSRILQAGEFVNGYRPQAGEMLG